MPTSIRTIALALHASIFFYGVVLFLLSQNAAEEWVVAWRILPENLVFTALAAALGLLATAFSLFVKPVIIRMALAESIALYGFLVAVLNRSFLLFVVFALWALLLQIYVGPWIIKDDSSS